MPRQAFLGGDDCVGIDIRQPPEVLRCLKAIIDVLEPRYEAADTLSL